MANISIILTSPRKDGNSTALARAVADGAMGLSTNIISIHDLNDLKFTYSCDHCDACKITGKCKIDDSITPLLEEIAKSDVVICATPLYFGRANSLFYLLIDRMYSYLDVSYHPYSKKGRFIPIITCDENVEKAHELQKELCSTFEYLGFSPMEGIVYAAHCKKHAAQEDSNILKIADELGTKLCE